ncbi:hypothetical protein TNCT_374631 [Trichonephila clavata]|uniref:Uncharacterized protein n=1 Tax=Trichonephila clavata TaxID=2740835 RepID=A0A8X6H0N2_TRICU|nr:hypothetical protein TNCT_374631 [Trichonephila clavata]
MRPRGGRSREGLTSKGESSTAGSRRKQGEKSVKTSPYPLKSRAGSRRRQGEDAATTSKERRARLYNLRRRADSRRSGFSSPVERVFVMEQFARRISQRSPRVEVISIDSTWSF